MDPSVPVSLPTTMQTATRLGDTAPTWIIPMCFTWSTRETKAVINDYCIRGQTLPVSEAETKKRLLSAKFTGPTYSAHVVRTDKPAACHGPRNAISMTRAGSRSTFPVSTESR